MATRRHLLFGLVVFFFLNISTGFCAQPAQEPVFFEGQHFSLQIHSGSLSKKQLLALQVVDKLAARKWENKKLIAIALAIALGPFGGHRLYLGTSPTVPVVYTITLGGGLGILPFTDIVAILLARDLDKFSNNNRVVMWID